MPLCILFLHISLFNIYFSILYWLYCAWRYLRLSTFASIVASFTAERFPYHHLERVLIPPRYVWPPKEWWCHREKVAVNCNVGPTTHVIKLIPCICGKRPRGKYLEVGFQYQSKGIWKGIFTLNRYCQIPFHIWEILYKCSLKYTVSL